MKVTNFIRFVFVFAISMLSLIVLPGATATVSAETITCGNGLTYELAESDASDTDRFCADKGGSEGARVRSGAPGSIGTCQPKSGTLVPTWYKYLDGMEVAGKCTVKMNFPGDAGKILLAIAEILLRVAGLIAVAYVIYGGFQFMLSQGEPDKAKEARRIIINALVGLVIAMMATVIVAFISRSLIS